MKVSSSISKDNNRAAKFPFQWAIFLGLIVLSFLAMYRYVPPNYPVNRDSGIFLYTGQQIVAGKMPYLDFWDHKGPLIFYLNALGVGLGQRMGMWFVECFFLCVAAVAGYVLIRRNLGPWLALWGTIAWVYSFYVILAGGNLTEEYSLPFNLLSIVLFDQFLKNERKLLLVIIGLLTGANALLRPNNIGIQVIAIGIILFTDVLRARPSAFVKNLLSVGLGVLLVWAPTAAFFYQKNALSALIYAMINFNIEYARSVSAAGGSSNLPLFLLAVGWPGWYAIVGWAMLLLDLIRKHWSMPVPLMVLFLVGFPADFVLATLSNRPYLHYLLLLLPYFGLFNALFLSRVFQHFWKGENQIMKGGLTIVLGCTMLFSLWSGSQLMNRIDLAIPPIGENAQIVQYVTAHTSPADFVLVWGMEPSINFLAKRASPTRFEFQTIFYNDMPANLDMQNLFLADLEKNKPALIVITAENPFSEHVDQAFDAELERFPAGSRDVSRAFARYVGRYYEYAEDIQDWKIYRLRR